MKIQDIKDLLTRAPKNKYVFSEQGKHEIIKKNEMLDDITEYYVTQDLRLDAIQEYPTNFEGILTKIISDRRLAMIVVSIQGGTSAIAQHGNLSNDQCKIICALALLMLLPELKQKLYVGDDFCSQLNLQWGHDIEESAFDECINILESLSEKMKKKIHFVRPPKGFFIRAAVYDEKKNSVKERYIILKDMVPPSLALKAILAAIHGFNYEQIDYVIDKKSLYSLKIVEHRKDIWTQLLHASVCHALGKWPELHASGWR